MMSKLKSWPDRAQRCRPAGLESVVPQTAAIGASRLMLCVPAKVGCLNRQPALSPAGGTGLHAPFASFADRCTSILNCAAGHTEVR